MPGDKDLLEDVDENSMAELDSLEGFAEIDDLTALEGIEEFQDLDDLAELGDVPLPDEMDGEQFSSEDNSMAEEIPVPDTDGIAAAFGEMTGKAPDGLFEDSAPMEEELETLMEESDTESADENTASTGSGKMTGKAPAGLFEDSTPLPGLHEDNGNMDAIDDATEELPLPDIDEDGGDVDTLVDDGTGELPLPDLEEDGGDLDALMNVMDDPSEELPLPESDGEAGDVDALVDAMDDETEELPLPKSDEEAGDVDALVDTMEDETGELPLPESDGEAGDVDALVDTMDDETGELPLPEPEEDPDAVMDAAMDAIDDMMADIPMPEEDGDVDAMLDGMLDDLALTDEASEIDVLDDSAEENQEDATDLFDLLENSEDTLSEDDINEVLNIGLPETDAEQSAQDKEPGLLKKLFGNVVNDEIAEAERKAAEEEKAAEAEKAEQDAVRKEEKEAEKAAKAEEKAAKKAAKAERKAARKAEKEAAKAEKKARKEEEAAKEEQFEVTGKLNKIGVAIIAIFTVVFLTAEILGTNIYGVSHAKRAANSYFELGKYTQAYQEILGTNLKEKDPDTYNKIKTVMQVQRSINAYNNYNEMNYYPDALNALLRGIQRYEANLESARELDVVSDMDQCKAQILSLLNSEFGVSESEAYALLALEKNQYDSQVVQLAMSR